jgi:hypothetical protein
MSGAARSLALLLAAAAPAAFVTVAAPLPAAAEAPERLTKLAAAARWDDLSEGCRKWLEKHLGEPDERDVRALLAEAEYQRLLPKATLEAVAAYISEFPETPRQAEIALLQSNLSLYEAAENPSESGYLAIADAFPGTAAATEARSRAEALAFEAAKNAGTARALNEFLGRYRDGAHGGEALDLQRERAWTEAEASGTADAWFRLRADDPGHPRAAEAYEREQARVLASLSAQTRVEELWKLARRYDGAPAGWTVLRMAVERATLRILGGDGTLRFQGALGATAGAGAAAGTGGAAGSPGPLDASGMRAAWLDTGSSLPRGATMDLKFTVRPPGAAAPADWTRLAFEIAASWGVPWTGVPAPGSAPANPGAGAASSARVEPAPPPCSVPGGGPAILRAELAQGEQRAAWEIPLRLAPCGGPLPFAVRRDAAGTATATGRLPDPAAPGSTQPLQVRVAGFRWNCNGPSEVLGDAFWLGCNGWMLAPLGAGWVVRPPGTEEPPLERTDIPWLEQLPVAGGETWSAPLTPLGLHFGAAAGCPLPAAAVVPGATAPGSAPDPLGEDALSPGGPSADPAVGATPRPSPELPAWVTPSLVRRVEWSADVDADGGLDRLLVLAARGEHPPWLVVALGAGDGTWAYATPLTNEPAADALPAVTRRGCALELAPASGPAD